MKNDSSYVLTQISRRAKNTSDRHTSNLCFVSVHWRRRRQNGQNVDEKGQENVTYAFSVFLLCFFGGRHIYYKNFDCLFVINVLVVAAAVAAEQSN